MNFKSDNTAGVHPHIFSAMLAANTGHHASYGADDYSKKLNQKFSEIFQTEVQTFFTSTGTAANSLALATLTRPAQTIFCHEQAHILNDECNAPEFFTGGASLTPVSGKNGKIDFEKLHVAYEHALAMRPHGAKPGALSFTQATECGTLYSIEALTRARDFCRDRNLAVHMDGARFANALVALNCTASELIQLAGVDVLSFGATKNGALCAEAVVLINSKYRADFDYAHKRAGQLVSKTRFFAAQFLGYFEASLWLTLAAHSNEMARRLSEIFAAKALAPIYPVEINEVFVELTPAQAKALQRQGVGFYSWHKWRPGLYRFVTSWATTEEDLTRFAAALAKACEQV